MGELSTPFGKAINKEMPLKEYPRPQMVRENFTCLNGEWEYAIYDINQPFKGYDGKILVPFSPECKLSGVGKTVMPNDMLFYKKEFKLTKIADKPRVLLHFDAVDYLCEVILNGKSVGKHRGGFFPFCFDVTEFILEDNVLELKVTDPTDTEPEARGKQKLKRGGIFYTAQSGIWQSVWLEQVSDTYIDSLRITPDIDKRLLTLNVNTNKPFTKGHIAISLRGEKVYESDFSKNDVSVQFGSIELWSPENPTLYDMVISVDNDEVASYFGMRKFSVKEDKFGKKRMYLNNLPYFHNGLLDQGYWSDGLLTPPSDEAMIYDIQTMKDMGFNMLRKHIKIEPLRWYYHCDKIGMIVWQDFVNGGGNIDMIRMGGAGMLNISVKDSWYGFFSRKNANGRLEFLTDAERTINHLYNVPALALWTPFNEGWGQFDSRMVVDKIKSIDKTRMIDHASGWVDQRIGDFKSLHIYWRPVKLPKDHRCYILTEFGGYSLPVENHYFQQKKAFGYSFYKSKEELFDALDTLYKRDVIGNINKGLSATVYTQVSDVEDEINGLLTFDREVEKVDKQKMRELNNAVYSEFEQAVNGRKE